MANYWMEDYDSPGDPDLDVVPFKKDIIQRCEEILKRRSSVRLGYVILDEMKLSFHKSNLTEILCAIEETGKYQSKFIKHKSGIDDFIVSRIPKKSPKERYWYLIDAAKLILGGVIGYIVSELLHKHNP